MAITYNPIETYTLSSTTANIVFSTIPQIYTDLVLVATRRSATKTTGGENLQFRLNGDNGANYANTYLVNGPSTARLNNMSELYTSAGGNEINTRYSVDVWNFLNYSNTTTYKTLIYSYMYAGDHCQLWAGSWRNNAAINTIDIFSSGAGNVYAIGSMFTLYGIKAK